MSTPNSKEVYGHRGFTNWPRPLPRRYPHTLPGIAKDTGNRIINNPFCAAITSIVIATLAIQATESATEFIRAPLTGQPSQPKEVAVINISNQTSKPNPESALSPLAKRVYKDTELGKFIRSLPGKTSVGFRLFSQQRSAIVASKAGINIRRLPHESAEKALPYSRGHQEKFTYDGEIIIQQNNEDGTISSTKWAILDGGSSIAFAHIDNERTGVDGKIIPNSIEDIDISTFGPESNEPLHMLRSKSDGEVVEQTTPPSVVFQRSGQK